MCNLLYENTVSQFNLPTDFAVRVVTMHALVYSGHVKYDKNNDIMSSKVNTAAPSSHRGPLEHNLESDKNLLQKGTTHLSCNIVYRDSPV